MHIVPYTPAHLDAVAALLAERHRVDRRHLPELPARYEEPGEMRTAVEETLPVLDAGVVVALDGDEVVGVLGARYLRPDPDSFMALVVPPRTARVSELLCVTAGGAAEALREMYAALSERWVSAGYFVHVVDAPAWNEMAIDAWFSLGFGRLSQRGLRDLGPIESVTPPGTIEVRRAGPEDAGEVARLTTALARYHANPPIYLPFLPEAVRGLALLLRERLTGDEHPCFFTVEDGRTLGFMRFSPPSSPAPWIVENTADLDEAYTEEAARGGGAASAVLAHGLAWAREQGYARCSVNWVSTNLVAARFWTGHGFRPMRVRLGRRVDERIAWARGDA